MSATVATAGGVVVRAFDGPSGPTGWQFSWDGRDENGALVAAGPYTVTVSGTDLDSGAVDRETFTIALETTPQACITSPAAGPVLGGSDLLVITMANRRQFPCATYNTNGQSVGPDPSIRRSEKN